MHCRGASPNLDCLKQRPSLETIRTLPYKQIYGHATPYLVDSAVVDVISRIDNVLPSSLATLTDRSNEPARVLRWSSGKSCRRDTGLDSQT